MSTTKCIDYRSDEEYGKCINVLRLFTTIVLFSFEKNSNKTRDIIIRNFIARGMASLESIYQVWQLGNYQDAWILHRSLLDRLFHLRYLSDHDGFELFDDWSFIKQFEIRNKLMSDQEMNKKVDKELRTIKSDERKRYTTLKQKSILWSRPEPEQIAKKMNFPFLYKYGYDYASTHVHPMANDGEEDYLRLTGLIPKSRFEQRVILHNSVLVHVLLLQEGLNASQLLWRTIISDFLDHSLRFLENGSLEYLKTSQKIASKGPDFDWCQPTPTS